MQAHGVQDILEKEPDFAVEDDNGFAQFWFADKYSGGMAWVGRFSGRSPWERHQEGDEYLYMIDGEVEVIVLRDNDEERVSLKQGELFVVPQGCWHRQMTTGTVVQIGATPGKTDHSEQEDPRLTD